ncbi:MAG TPA: hypothetical protein VM100_11425 [Longimicrobiales bacterium]|nr:hypothetical protein [Longimicrobiales bacterium]
MHRQPVHTVYGGAHLFRSDTAKKLGDVALRTFDEHAADVDEFSRRLGIPENLAREVHQKVRARLEREAVEDFRIDFEDGYGNRPDEEEDGHAVSAAKEVVKGFAQNTLPLYIGIRIKTLNPELARRSLRTLDLFIATLAESRMNIFENFFVTLPKLTSVDQPELLARTLGELEVKYSLQRGALRFEIMVEAPQTLFTPTGAAALPLMVDAGKGRITAAHFGTYDFTASMNVTAAHQHMNHPVCDFARAMMQACLSDRVWLSDGSTAVLPVGDRDAIYAAWKQHYDDVRRSLMLGFYQGWDLHPGQLVTRYAALYSFFLEAYDPAAARLRNFMANLAQATLLGTSFDDAATGQGLLNYFLRGINSGAFGEEEVAASTTLSLEELRTRSFKEILRMRQER